ncbi:hypothetical protein AAY473_010216 [Plecturocebus cupreus]
MAPRKLLSTGEAQRLCGKDGDTIFILERQLILLRSTLLDLSEQTFHIPYPAGTTPSTIWAEGQPARTKTVSLNTGLTVMRLPVLSFGNTDVIIQKVARAAAGTIMPTVVIHRFWDTCVELAEMGFHDNSQAGLKLRGSSNPPALVSQGNGITGMSYCTRPILFKKDIMQ